MNENEKECAPYCPTVDVPPKMRMDLPAHLVSPSSSQGAGIETDRAPGVCTQRPVVTVARARGIDAAWSKEMFSGTCVTQVGQVKLHSLNAWGPNKTHLRCKVRRDDGVLLEGSLLVGKVALEQTR